ncbi:MAG: hypothetical protein KC422_25540 [Trueperaceae bacterium]|nr:hypothetical protein [Trueperaceae bacterium]
MSRFLVTYACSKPATYLIASQFYGRMKNSGYPTSLSSANEVFSVEGFDAIILLAELSHGQVHQEGAELLDSFQSKFKTLPLWLYLCGSFHSEEGRRLWDSRSKTRLEPLLERLDLQEVGYISELDALHISTPASAVKSLRA